MIKVLRIASYLYARYYDDYKVAIDEMKLHKLLYFVQRESLVSLDKPAFGEAIQAWKFGPVVPVVHIKYSKGQINDQYRTADFGEFKPIIDHVYSAYSSKDSWTLSMISHEEYSWKQARIGIPADMNSRNELKLADIAVDAARIKTRRALLESYLGISASDHEQTMA
jgi:uncharacterized phage-associated protein